MKRAKISKKSSATKQPAKKAKIAKVAAPKAPASRKAAAPRKSAAARKSKPGAKRAARKGAGPTSKGAPKAFPRRADFGAPIDGFFAKQPAQLRVILEALRAIVDDVAPDATASIKWGMPFYSIDGAMMCALGAHKSHVNLILAGPPASFVDPGGRLEGAGKTGLHLTLRNIDELPRGAVRGWLRTAIANARAAS